MEAGESTEVKIQLVDVFGNVLGQQVCAALDALIRKRCSYSTWCRRLDCRVSYTLQELDLVLVLVDAAGAVVWEEPMVESTASFGTWSAAYETDVAGAYTLQVLDRGDGDAVLTSADVEVECAAPLASSVVLFGFPPATPYATGDSVSFGVALQDLFGNALTDPSCLDDLALSVATTAGEVAQLFEPPMYDAVSGQFTVSFEVVSAGRLYVELVLEGVAIQNALRQPYSALVAAGGPSATTSTFASSALENGLVETQVARILLQALDSSGARIMTELPPNYAFAVEATVNGVTTRLTEAAGTIVFLVDGAYSASYSYAGPALTATSELAWSVFLVVDGVDQLVGTRECLMYPLSMAADMTLAQANSALMLSSTPTASGGQGTVDVVDGALDVRGGSPDGAFYLVLQLRSSLGLDMQEDLPAYAVTFSKSAAVTLSVTPLTLGRYELMLTTTTLGDFNVFNIKVDGVAIKTPSFVWHVTQSTISLSTTTIGGAGMSMALAGELTSFTIFARDAFGNDVGYSALDGAPPFLVQLVPDDPTEAVYASVVGRQEGSNEFVATYVPTITGESDLRVSLNGELLPGAIPVVLVSNGPLAPERTTYSPDLRGAGWGLLSAGVQYTLNVYAYDNLDNSHDSPPLRFELEFTPSTALASLGVTTTRFSSTAGSSPNEYSVQFSLQKAGSYTVVPFETLESVPELSVSGSDLIVLTVGGGEPDVALSVVSGAGANGGVASDLETSFLVSYFDSDDNPTPAWGPDSPAFDTSDTDAYLPVVTISVTPTFGRRVVALPGPYRIEAVAGDSAAVYRVSFSPAVPGAYPIQRWKRWKSRES